MRAHSVLISPALHGAKLVHAGMHPCLQLLARLCLSSCLAGQCVHADVVKVQCYLEVGVEGGAKACGYREAAQAAEAIFQDPVDAGCRWQ